MMAVEVLFWFVAALLGFVYFGYPVLLWLICRFRPASEANSVTCYPSVALVIAAYNEEAVIAKKIQNSLDLDYAEDKLEIIVFSDASSDRTDEIVRSYEEQGVKLLRIEGRKGKTHCQNVAVEKAKGEVVVFSDANSMYEEDAVRRLVECLADPKVGCVSGELRYLLEGGGVQGEGVYWRYEQLIKRLESRASSVVGANGAIYAVRRPLYVFLRDDAISDFVEPLMLVHAGYRAVHCPEAVAWEETAADVGAERRRRIRIVARAVHSLLRLPGLKGLLNPLGFGLFSLQLWTHRVLRWLSGLFMLVLLGLNLVLLGQGLVYTVLLVGQIAFYVAALAGWACERAGVRRCPGSVHVAYYFCLSCGAMLWGVVLGVAGRPSVTWQTTRG